MEFLFGGLAGLVWGALAAVVNRAISKKALEKNSTRAMLAANVSRMAVDLVALGAVFLLRNRLPFRYEAMLVGTAVALSMLNIVFAYRLAGEGFQRKKEDKEEE